MWLLPSTIFFFFLITATWANNSAFLALMVQNPTVVQQVKQIETNLTEANPQFVKFVHDTAYLHVRLNTIEFDETTLPTIQKFMQDLPKAICNVSYSIPVLFAGTSVKSNTTLYGKMNAMSSTIITSVHQKIHNLLSTANITTLDIHEIFQPKMDIVELDNRKHDDLLQIMNNKTGGFRLSTGDFIKEIVLYNSANSGAFHDEIARAVLAPCSNFTRVFKPELFNNRVPLYPLKLEIADF